jgi:hypothetical protein
MFLDLWIRVCPWRVSQPEGVSNDLLAILIRLCLFSEGYVWWVNDGKPAWWIASSAMKPVPEADVGQRPVPYEPMYLIVNLGLSENFGAIESVSREANYRSSCRVDAHP